LFNFEFFHSLKKKKILDPPNKNPSSTTGRESSANAQEIKSMEIYPSGCLVGMICCCYEIECFLWITGWVFGLGFSVGAMVVLIFGYG
jgi:hypothetical protein